MIDFVILPELTLSTDLAELMSRYHIVLPHIVYIPSGKLT